MATNIGSVQNVPYSAKWVYADFSNNRWESNQFVTTVTVYTQYQHQNVSYQGVYEETGAMPYTVTNANADGSTQSGSSASEYVAISYLQYTGLKWGRTFNVYLPRGTTQKGCYITSQNPGWDYAFWNYPCGGSATTPTFSWAEPTANIEIVNNVSGTLQFNLSSYVFADGAVPASFTSEVLYCDTNSNPITEILNNTTAQSSNTVSITVDPNVVYYWKYIITDNHGTSKTYTGSLTSYGNPPTISYSNATVTAIDSATINYSATYEENASFASIVLGYGINNTNENTIYTNTITGLNANTLYVYSLTVIDNFGRSSSPSNGYFTTWANPPVISDAYIRNVGIDYVTGVVTCSTPDDISKVLGEIKTPDGLTTIQSNEIYTPSGENVFTFYNLDRGTDYLFYFRLRTKGSLIWTDPVSVPFSTLPDTSVYLVNSDGTVNKKGLFYGLGKTELLDSMTYVNGGLLNASEQALQYMIDNFVPESGYSYVRTLVPITVAPSTEYTLECDSSVQFEIFEFNNNSYKNYIISSTSKNFITTAYTNNVMLVFKKASPFTTTDLEALNKTLYKSSQKKKITKTDIVKVSGIMRYIDVGQSGNTLDEENYICEVEVYDDTNTNVALGKTVTGLNWTSMGGESYCVDGDTTNAHYMRISHYHIVDSQIIYEDASFRIDLGAEYNIKKVVVYRYSVGSPIYYGTYVYGRNANKELCYKFDDYKKDGLYAETSSGKTFNAVYSSDDSSLPVINSIVKDPIGDNLIGTNITVYADRSGYGG